MEKLFYTTEEVEALGTECNIKQEVVKELVQCLIDGNEKRGEKVLFFIVQNREISAITNENIKWIISSYLAILHTGPDMTHGLAIDSGLVEEARSFFEHLQRQPNMSEYAHDIERGVKKSNDVLIDIALYRIKNAIEQPYDVQKIWMIQGRKELLMQGIIQEEPTH